MKRKGFIIYYIVLVLVALHFDGQKDIYIVLVRTSR